MAKMNKTEREKRYCIYESAWGWIAMAATDFGICNTCLPVKTKEEAEYQLQKWKVASTACDWFEDPRDALLINAIRQLNEYFNGHLRRFDLPLDLSDVTSFRRSVYECAIKTLPCGETCSYGELAKRIHRPKAARAVGQAMRANPVPPIMPCHRVIANNGDLGGFGGGLAMKRRMLELEQA